MNWIWCVCGALDSNGNVCGHRYFRLMKRILGCPKCARRVAQTYVSPKQPATRDVDAAPSKAAPIGPELGSLQRPLRCGGERGFTKYLSSMRGPNGELLWTRLIDGEAEGEAQAPAAVRQYRVELLGSGRSLQVFVDVGATDQFDRAPFGELILRKEYLEANPSQQLNQLLPPHQAAPEQFSYIWAKSRLLLTMGPLIYSERDYFGMPRPNFDIASVTDLAAQVVRGHAGIDARTPLRAPDLERARQFMACIHFEATDIREGSLGAVGSPCVVEWTHQVYGNRIELYFHLNHVTSPQDSAPLIHPATGIVLPGRISILSRADRAIDYERQSPGQGMSLGYDDPSQPVSATVYLYTSGISNIPEGSGSEIIIRHFAQSLENYCAYGRSGELTDLEKKGTGEVTCTWADGSLTWLRAEFAYRCRHTGVPMSTFFYVRGARNHFVKLRTSFPTDSSAATKRVEQAFVVGVSRILNGHRSP